MSDASPDTDGLVACTRRLDADVDLVALGARSGLLWRRGPAGIVGLGDVARLPVARHRPDGPAEAQAALAGIGTDDEVTTPGSGPVAFAAFPFRPDVPGELVVPEIAVGRDADGNRWLTVIGPEPGTADRLAAALERVVDVATRPLDPAEPTSYTVTTPMDPAEWTRRLAGVRDRLAAGELTKVVLAREAEMTTDVAIDPARVVERLAATFASAIVFRHGTFCGASPELLVSRHGDVVRSHPLAGTAPRSADPGTDARLAADLLASTKDRWEHEITISAALDLLLPFCSYVDAEPEPSLVRMANVQHLGTLVEGRLSSPAASVLELVQALHPTPAVGGEPRDQALAVIDEVEGYERGRYAGPTGWVDGAGNGAFAVAIRSAEIDGPSVSWSAGVGVVADSDPDAELAETRAKFQALLGALLRP